jgi:hypothetical protein
MVWTILTVVLVVGALLVVGGLLPGSLGGSAGMGLFRRPQGPKRDDDPASKSPKSD